MFGCIQSLRNHLRGVNTGSNFNSISLKNHKGNIIIWIVKFFLEIGSITWCCSCCWIRPFCGDEYGLIDHWSGIFSYKNMSIIVQLQFDSWSKNSWIENMIVLMQGCCCFCCYSNPADFEGFFLSFFLHWRIKLSHDCAAEKSELTIGFWKPSVPTKYIYSGWLCSNSWAWKFRENRIIHSNHPSIKLGCMMGIHMTDSTAGLCMTMDM